MSTEQATSDSVTPVQEENAEKAESVHTYHTSTSSSAAARKEAKAYAAKVKLQFAEMEAEMKRKQAAIMIAFNEAKMKKEREDLTVEQELLSCRKEVAVAEAEASAYNILDAPSKANSKVDSFIRTKSFVDADNNFRLSNTVPKQTLNHDAPDFVPNYTSFHQTVPPDLAPFHTSTQQPAARDPYVTDFTRYLLKKDLLLSRLTCFDDKPENYRTWKVSFKTVMNELNVSSLEELDMLVKWTGPESKKQVLNIKAANVENPIVGLTKAWNHLEERYGCPEMLESSIKKRLDSFPKLNVKDIKKLYELSDLVSEIECLKGQSNLCALFSYFDSSTGVNHIVSKLPYYLQQKWTTYAVKYMEDRGVVYPPFAVFAKFLQEQSRIRNNQSFIYDSTHFSGKKDQSPVSGIQKQLIVKKTGLKSTASSGDDKVVKCPLHHTAHSINKCRAFLAKTFADRIKYLREKNICLRCCESDSHWKKDCTAQIKCTICNSDTHTAALHKDKPTRQMQVNKGQSGEETLLKSEHVGNEGGERSTPHAFNQFVASNVQKPPAVDSMNINSACTRICGDANGTGKSCAKIVLGTVHVTNHKDIAVKVYIIIDDQSNQSLGSTQLFDQLGVAGNETEYILTSCAGQYRSSGRKLHNLVIDSYNQSARLVIPTVTECNYLPSNKDEIPTPEVAMSYPHFQDIASEIPLFDSGTDIMLLIGRDVIRAHHVIDQRVGPANTPYAQQLCLGWTIIGESCLGNCHLPNVVNVKKTNLLPNGRESILQPCSSVLKVKEVEPIGHNVFIRTSEDEKPGLSRDDRSFLNIMSSNFNKDEEGHWICPLPLREDRPRLANDYPLALKRAQMLDQSLRKDPIKRDHFITFMDKMLRNAHAERAPELREDEECWYIPIFGIYHPHKPGNIRIVFDSAVKYNGISLNDVLYTGPDLTNSLLGILMRFRREPVAVIADIEQMFYCFRVNVEHRNLLRFIWHEDNDFSKPLVDYRMCVHIFGSTSSPAIATYGLRKAASLSDRGSDVTDFVHNEFYVDDSLISLQTSEQAVDLITRTQQVLQNEGNLRLHKIASNNIDVMNAFPTTDLSKDVKDLHLGSDSLPTQRSLGITWSLDSDMFMFHVSEVQQSFTRRGILSTVNSLFDPLGFLAPVVIEGKILLRNLVQGTTDWDEPLSPQLLDVWENWTSSLKHLQDIKIPRMILSGSFTAAEHKTVHIFCDASEEAISSVGYLQAMVHNDIQLGFIIGKAKVAPSHGHTVPRLELCSAVLAVEIAELISSHLHLPIDNFKFYSDGRIVFGYLNNTSRRFYTYVANRVHSILSSTKPEQWFYVSSENNPADKATRPISASELPNCAWLNGPSFLKQGESSDNSASFALQDPDRDKEVRPEIKTLKTELGSDSLNLGSHRFERFSNWRKLIRAVSCLQHIAQTFHGDKCSNGWHTCDESHTVHALSAAQNHIFRVVQHEIYHEEIECLKKGQSLSKSSPVLALSPYLDTENILRVGGRLDKSCLTEQEKHPILIPGRHNIAKLIIGHYHDAVYHEGRHITEGSIRSAGIWITGAKSLVSSFIMFISKCVKCRELRGQLSYQKMANLPPDRSEPSPPFTCAGVDCFGPWQIVTRRTRGGQAASKRWGVMFTCLSTRAVHIEVIEELSSSSFINALRRLIAIRGPVRIFRSDRGTNFVGSTEDLGIQAINTDDTQLKEFLSKNQSTWLFNPPHASHMGGVWERMIGVTRNILNSLLMDLPGGGLTHEVLVTFLAEVSAIINSRPLVALTTDPHEPLSLTPSLLLTQKSLVDTGFCTQIDMKDMYKKQWKRVQVLAEMFRTRWKDQYLQSLQNRRKWQDPKRNFCSGDVVLVRDKQSARNNWPMGIVQETYAGHDGLVRKVNVRVVNDGHISTFTRPVVELVLLVEND